MANPELASQPQPKQVRHARLDRIHNQWRIDLKKIPHGGHDGKKGGRFARNIEDTLPAQIKLLVIRNFTHF